LAFDNSGVRLASGSRDTDIIIWDLVSETGLFKLRGHKDQIVGLCWIYPEASAENRDQEESGMDLGESTGSFILSASKDATVKLWDIDSQHCLETHLAQTNGECWALGVTPDQSGCITAGQDGELKVWSLDLAILRSSHQLDRTDDSVLQSRGVILRKSKDRTTGIVFHPTADFFAAYGPQKAVEIWRIKSETEVQKSLQRKRKRRKEKATKQGEEPTVNGDDQELEASITDYFVEHTVVRPGGKVGSIDWVSQKSTKTVQMLISCTNNTLEVYDITTKDTSKRSTEETTDYDRTFIVDTPGHRTDIRAMALSSDDRMVATASSGLLKIWNVQTGACLRTLECGYALCCSFLPGDKIVLVGTKSGELELFDIAASSLIESIQAHDGSIWTLQVHPDGRSCVTGGADKLAKFWKFEIAQEEIPGTKRTIPRLKLSHSRTLKMNDDILSVCFSPDARLLAVSTLDNTVKVFFNDSLKLFLNLYGHKLPVIGISISSDSRLIATSSADKNIRLWGLDFGDCHKALFGHQDSIMAVKFIPKPETQDGHFMFTISKDRNIKTWDGDKFEQVQRIVAHHGEIWAMCVSQTGSFFVTASHDKSIRVWSLADDLIFLEEEREKEMEELYEQTMTTSLEAEEENLTGEGDDRVVSAHKQSMASLTAAEKIMEALELGLEDLDVMNQWEIQRRSNPKLAVPRRDPLFLALGNISAERHVLNTISKIPAAQLQDALLVLPFSSLPGLFRFTSIWIKRQWEVPLVCRVLFFMLKTHQKQIVSSRDLKLGLTDIRKELRETLTDIKNIHGFNVAALRCIGEKAKDNSIVTLEDAEKDPTLSTKKRVFANVA
jgi:U3 small nucleolar RNA-associated protein 12